VKVKARIFTPVKPMSKIALFTYMRLGAISDSVMCRDKRTVLLHFTGKVSCADEPDICKLGRTELFQCENARAIMVWRIRSISRVVDRDYAALFHKRLPGSKSASSSLTRVIAI
jgi:hypothetical protein